MFYKFSSSKVISHVYKNIPQAACVLLKPGPGQLLDEHLTSQPPKILYD